MDLNRPAPDPFSAEGFDSKAGKRGVRYTTIAVLMLAIVAIMLAPSARAEQDCSRTVIFTLPGVTWSEVRRVAPPAILDAAADGSAGSISVRTISTRTSYSSGFATIGAGSRVDAPRGLASAAGGSSSRSLLEEKVEVTAAGGLRELAGGAGYGAVPGALASALDGIESVAVGNGDLGVPPFVPAGYGRWTLLAAMDASGTVDRVAAGPALLRKDKTAPFGLATDEGAIRRAVNAALEGRCVVVVVDHGDLTRVDEFAVATATRQPAARARALKAADDLLAHVRGRLDSSRDLLIVVSPTSPWWDETVHLGVAIAAGPRFERGRTLESASTRRTGIVTLPDVAPTVLAHLGLSRPAAMTGRPWFDVPAEGGDRLDRAVNLDREASFVESMKGPVSSGFVAFQVAVYLLVVLFFARRAKGSEAEPHAGAAAAVEMAALGIASFPLATFLAGTVDGHDLGSLGFVALLVGIDAALVLVASLVRRGAFGRFLVITALTTLVICADLALGGPLQLNTVFGYSPIVAGRFAGLGNIAFAVLGVASLLTGALLAHLWSNLSRALLVSGVLFAATIVFDGAPHLGSDVGGTIALVPTMGVTWLLLSGRKPGPKALAIVAVAGLVMVAVFLMVDVSRPPDQQTHLARLFEDVRDRGGGVLADTLKRKASANLRLFRTTVWTYFVPPAIVAMALLMRRPRGSWERVASAYPKLRAGLIGGLTLALLGFAVNDSGIVVPAVILSFLVPMAMLVHLSLEREVPA